MGSWAVETTDQFAEWYASLSDDEQDAVNAAVDLLEERGPALGRPVVDTLKGSSLPNMKELIPRASNIRILFAFDPRRTAILLLGGDKTGDWDSWYDESIPVAEDLYAEYLNELREEGLIPSAEAKKKKSKYK